MKQGVSTVGIYIFLAAIAGIGLVHLVTGNFPAGLEPVSTRLPYRHIVAWAVGIIMIMASVGALVPQERRASYVCLAAVFFVLLIYPNVVKLLKDIHDGGQWTAVFETLSLLCGVLIFRHFYNQDPLIFIARVAFALALTVFGILHIVYFDYIQTLIPSWIPFPKFWGWVIPGVFFATALASVVNIRLITGIFGLMFLCWVIILHMPRVISSPHVEPEWTSLFVALAMGAIGFMLTGKKNEEQKISLKVLSFYRANKPG
ncbi:MAG TPA: hypothetical protein VKR32_09955 [Puia sp.]|nr:hypothetical protein [Puia sp.]